MLSSLLRRQGGRDVCKASCSSSGSSSSSNSSTVICLVAGRRIKRFLYTPSSPPSLPPSSPSSSSSSSSPARPGERERGSGLILPPRPRWFSSSSLDLHSAPSSSSSSSSSSASSLHSPHDDDPYTFSGKAPRMLELVLVRHGQSEGNVAYRRSLAGDHSLYSGEFLRRHSSKWRLTDLGRQQAEIAGEWLRNEIPGKSFDRFYVSEYIRCMETAARLNIPDARWFAEVFLRERDWGQMDLMSWAERTEKMAHELKRRDLDRYLYAPPGGESMADVALRVDRFIHLLHRETANKRVLVVCHGEVMWAMRTRLERMSLMRYKDLIESKRFTDHIHNGHILVYTRINPETGEIAPNFRWMKSSCPWDPSLSPNRWEEINRAMYSNNMLLATAETVPRLISGIPDKVEKDERGDIIKSADTSLHLLDNTGKDLSTREEPVLPLEIKKAVIVVKTTRFEVERDHYNADGEELRRLLAVRGIVYDRLKRSSDAHNFALNEVVDSLKASDVEIKTVKAMDVTAADLEGYDVIFAAGGDGTFLKTASRVTRDVPILGINTDPSYSNGHLCSCRIEKREGRKEDFRTYIDRLRSGAYAWKHHRRLRIKLINAEGHETVVPQLVLNEVFFSEADPSRPSIFDIGIDTLERETVRCSGAIVSTGTGSTAWFESAAKVHAETVADVLKEAGVVSTESEITEITHRLNERNLFPAPRPELAYIVREPIVNRALAGCKNRLGRAQRVSLRSLGWDGQLTIDGITCIPFNFGVQGIVEVGSEPGDTLRTMDFEARPHIEVVENNKGQVIRAV